MGLKETHIAHGVVLRPPFLSATCTEALRAVGSASSKETSIARAACGLLSVVGFCLGIGQHDGLTQCYTGSSNAAMPLTVRLLTRPLLSSR